MGNTDKAMDPRRLSDGIIWAWGNVCIPVIFSTPCHIHISIISENSFKKQLLKRKYALSK